MSIITLPGLVELHIHLPVPGGEHKQDSITDTTAVLTGGITTILATPNTAPPLTIPAVLEQTLQKVQRAIYCHVGLFAVEKIQKSEEIKC